MTDFVLGSRFYVGGVRVPDVCRYVEIVVGPVSDDAYVLACIDGLPGTFQCEKNHLTEVKRVQLSDSKFEYQSLYWWEGKISAAVWSKRWHLFFEKIDPYQIIVSEIK